MSKNYTDTQIATRIWLFTCLTLSIVITGYAFLEEPFSVLAVFPLSLVASIIMSLPALTVLYFTVFRINYLDFTSNNKILVLISLNFFIALLYGSIAGLIDTSFEFFNDYSWLHFFETTGVCTGILFACTCCAVTLNFKRIKIYFSTNNSKLKNTSQNFQSQINTYMEPTYSTEQNIPHSKSSQSNKTFIKGLITGLLIIILLIPTLFISGLITERKERNETIVTEASNQWATAQTISGPYLFIPYKNTNQHLIVLPENLNMKGNVIPENRKRSIYKILLYKSAFEGNGIFIFNLPKDVDTSALQFADAKICMNISDFKGLEDKITITFNDNIYELSSGLPTTEIDSTGLSAPVELSETDLAKRIAFNFAWKIKGSGTLHFLPLSGNSMFDLKSSWPSPSFDGNTIPNENKVDENGFSAKWIFNKANLPFGTVLRDGKAIQNNLAFGVGILQPVDDYAKTERCIKYAVLFIGLTFSLFFIVEIMQKKPVHPVQYVLVGIALVIFYTLLLSISEFIHFDYAYLIASAATVSLISLYAKSHFKTWKIASLFAAVLSSLYGFNYVLISLEDTALLVGSVGLFVVLALVMYASRKINWYNPTLSTAQTEAV